MKQEYEFSVRCYVNRTRKLTHELTVEEAKNFHAAALHLAKYLKENYEIERPLPTLPRPPRNVRFNELGIVGRGNE